jgi:hypothetical protein
MAQLRRHKAEFEDRAIRLIAVSPSEGSSAESVCGVFDFPFTCLGDTSGGAYDAYGLERGNLGKIIRLRTIWRGIQAFAGGNRQGETIGDRFRLPGAFVVNEGGELLWAWRGRDASEHPRAAVILSAFDEMAGK